VSDQWHTALKGGLKPAAADTGVLAAWWTTLNDEALSNLIERAVAGNLNLKMAKARVRQARASPPRGGCRLLSLGGLLLSGSRVYSSSDTVADRVNDLYAAGFDASWRLTFSAVCAVPSRPPVRTLDAAREDLRDVLVSLLEKWR
jgi:outer membrane protein TolC